MMIGAASEDPAAQEAIKDSSTKAVADAVALVANSKPFWPKVVTTVAKPHA